MALKHWMEYFSVFHDVKPPGLAFVSVPSHEAETPLAYRTRPILRRNNSHSRQLLTRLLCEEWKAARSQDTNVSKTGPLGEVAEQRCKQRRPATRFLHCESCPPTTSSLWGLTCIFWLAGHNQSRFFGFTFSRALKYSMHSAHCQRSR